MFTIFLFKTKAFLLGALINVDIILCGLGRVAHYCLVGWHGATENSIRFPNRPHLSHVKGQRGKRG